jgi:uncharacterized iron-regulated membrane protein
LLVLVSSLLFFTQAAGRAALWFFGLTMIPASLFAFCWWWERRHAPPASSEWKGGML